MTYRDSSKNMTLLDGYALVIFCLEEKYFLQSGRKQLYSGKTGRFGSVAPRLGPCPATLPALGDHAPLCYNSGNF